jgi:hypothetical protein
MRLLAGLFLIAHGLVHLGVWVSPFDPAKAPFNPCHSWVLAHIGKNSTARPIAVTVAITCAATFSVAGIGVLVDSAWATGLAIGSALISLLLTAAYFHRWLVFNVAINLVIISIAQ